MIKKGIKAPEFKLLNQDEEEVKLKDFKGKYVVLYFYPKDNTPGCTTEALEFTFLAKEFKKLNTVILGVSKDSCSSHKKFVEGKKLTIQLLSDEDKAVNKLYGVWQKKKFMGKEFMGTVRTTFLIDTKGKVVQVWQKVKAKGHAETVLEKIKEIKK
jgi:peroxiredoxin Q/BCP